LDADPDNDGDADAALRTLLMPFAGTGAGLPALEQARVLLANARALPALPPMARAWRLQQDFKPFVDALARQGLAATTGVPEGEFDVALLLLPRQKARARSLLAQCWKRLPAGGVLAASAGNDSGGRSLPKELAALGGAPAESLSKHHCRVAWVRRAADAEDAVADAWIAAGQPVAIEDGRFLSRPGVFAWDRVDAASRLLAAHLPPGLAGRGADLGCGYGYLAAEGLARAPGIVALDLYEADANALALARANLADAAPDVALAFHWHDVAAGLPRHGYDFIVSNPPFHSGRADQPALGRAFIAAAAGALRPGGRLLLVANRHLPYEEELGARFASVRVLAQELGFKVVEATRA
jgi:16S rRNA (guanine1207-N2)-methyltransferase